MPLYDILVDERLALARSIAASRPEHALDVFLATRDPHGVKRLSPVSAEFFGEITIGVRLAPVPVSFTARATEAIRAQDMAGTPGSRR